MAGSAPDGMKQVNDSDRSRSREEILLKRKRPEKSVHKQMAGRLCTSIFQVMDRPFEDCISIDEIMLLHPVPVSRNDPGNLVTLLTLEIPEAFGKATFLVVITFMKVWEILDRSGEEFPDKEQREHIPVLRDDQ